MHERIKIYYEFGPFRLDPSNGTLLRNGEVVSVPPKAMEVLQVLVEHGTETITKHELMDRIWPDTCVEEGNLSVNIFALRRALGDDANKQQYIKTYPRRGYRFIADVRTVTPSNASSNSTDAVMRLRTENRELPGLQFCEEKLRAGADNNSGSTEPAKLYSARRVGSLRRGASTSLRSRLSILVLCALFVTLATGSAYVWSQKVNKPANLSGIRSLAVLPFKTVDDEPGDEYLGAAIAETIASSMSGLRQITVRPSTATLSYTSGDKDPVEVGRALRSDAVLEGSIVKVGDSLRITARLISVEDGLRLCEITSADQLEDLPAVLKALPEQVSRGLGLQLGDRERAAFTAGPTSDVQALRLWLKGRYLLHQRNWNYVREGIDCLEHAIRIDPTFSAVYADLAYAWIQPMSPEPASERAEKAMEAAKRAVRLNEGSAEAHTALGRALTICNFEWPAAEKEFKLAIELSPNYADAHYWYSYGLSAIGRHDEAIAELKWALEIDPLSPRINLRLGWAFYLARRFDRAIDQLRQTPIELDTANYQAFWRLGLTYAQKGMYEDATSLLQKAVAISGGHPVTRASLAYVLSKTGKEAEARKILAEVDQQRRGQERPYLIAASVYSSLGDNTTALALLEEADRRCGTRIIDIAVEPMLDGLKSDPRFQDLVRRVGVSR
jgi:DNA-binding winged helix-turn-helix (wHTH) protein/tetratricopeptide (TPR) repeat protein